MTRKTSHQASKVTFFQCDKVAASVLALVFGALFAAFVSFGAAPVQAAENPKYASIVIDAATGEILHSRYADKSLHPASTAKMMTLLLTFDAIESGKTSLRDRVYISQRAQNMVPSKLDLGVGATIRVEDAIYALVTKSANDIAVALAEHVGGSEANFATMMNRKAQQLGMTRTHFRNASGLHDARQVSTVRDMAKLGRALVYQYPKYYGYFSTRSFTYKGRTYRNHNRLMETYAGMDGLKTGFIGPSGFNLVASAKRGDRRLIGVVFGGRTSQSRNAHMASLLDTAFGKKGGTGAPSLLVADAENVIASGVSRNVPVPERKPVRALAQQSVQPAAPQAQPPVQMASALPMPVNLGEESVRWAELAPMLQSKAISRLIGEGDYDPAAIRRLETGYMAISAIKGETHTPAAPPATVQKAALTPAQTGRDWSIQIGAYSSRVKTDAALQDTLKRLPANLRHGTAVIAPLRAGEGWLFRGRLSGYSKAEAESACARIRECLPVGPQSQ